MHLSEFRTILVLALVSCGLLAGAATGATITVPADYGTIQQAIDAAVPGDTVAISAGNYEEQLHITKNNLTLAGAGVGSVTVLSPADLPLFYTTTIDNYPIVFIDGCTGVALSGVTIDGAGRGNANYRFQGIAFWNAGGAATDVNVNNVIDTPFSGSQHGVGVYAYNNTGGPYVVNLTRVRVDNYQKGGIALNGGGLTANVVDCTTIGRGATDVTAQNGIQLYGTTGGTIEGCDVSGNIYTGDGWAASGILLISAGAVDITGTSVADGDPAVYCQDTNATATNVSIANSDVDSGNGFYVRIQSGFAKAGGDDLDVEFDPSPFGDAMATKDAAKATGAVQITNCRFVGQTTGYGFAASNYVVEDLIDVDMTGTEISNWEYGLVAYGSGGEVEIDAHDNGIFGNAYGFYASSALASTQNASGNYWGITDPTAFAPDFIDGAIDYTPWIGGGTDLAPGFAGDFSEVWVDDDGPQIGAEGRLAEALSFAALTTLHVAPGEFVGTAQLVVDGDLQVLGDPADPAILRPGFSTGGSGDARGWWLVGDGDSLDMRDLILDGDGHDIYQAVRAVGGGQIIDCGFRNISYPGYSGVAIAAFGATPWTIRGCTFENIGRIGALLWSDTLVEDCVYTGKGVGDHLDYFADIGGGANVTVQGCTVTGNLGVASSDGSTSAALMATTLYGDGTTVTFTDNTLTGNTVGAAIGYDAADNTVAVVTGNNLADNEYGIENTGPNVVDGLGNWWGDSSGPEHPTLNPTGLGSKVSDNVDFDPWLGRGSFGIVQDLDTINCGDNNTATLTVQLTTDEFTPPVFGFSMLIHTTAEVEWADPSSLAPFGATTRFFFMDQGNGVYMISGTTQGDPTQPIVTDGVHDLFEITATSLTEGIADITFTSPVLRDPDNVPIAAFATGTQITVDCTAPAAITAITAEPGHNKVDVSWTHNGLDVDHYAVFRGLWYDTDPGTTAYPEYDDLTGDVEPTRPADYAAALASAEWAPIADIPAGTLTLTDNAMTEGRGVYYYEVFAIDAGTNAGAPAPDNDRATNYWLGDVKEDDGVVDVINDMTVLGDCFGVDSNHGRYNNICDVGPTDDWSRTGIPETDNWIDFEDLMVFAMNFGVVGAKADRFVATSIDLAWVRLAENRWALRLNGGQGLQGVRIRADLPTDALVNVTAGDLLDAQSAPTFLRNVGNGLDANLAVIGNGAAFTGAGDLVVVEFAGAIPAGDLTIDARNIENGRLEIGLSETTDTEIPNVFKLGAAYPNPFNPLTHIRFSLPESQRVVLAVYGIDGRKVATLANEIYAAGSYEVIWSGRDDAGQTVASGAYFYRIDAGPYSQVRKMTLIK